MKDIEKLVQAARNENFDEFKNQFYHFKMAVASIGNTTYGRATQEKAWMFICGCLSSRLDDLRSVAKASWKLQAQEGLTTKDRWEEVLSDFSCVLLACDKESAIEIIDDFKNETQPSMQGAHRSLHMLTIKISEWVSKQKWEGDLVLDQLIQTHNLDMDNLVYRCVRTKNTGLLEYIIRTSDQETKEYFALYVAGNWAQKIVEQSTPQEISAQYNEFHPMFCAIENDFYIDNFIDCGLSDRLKDDGVDIGAVHWAIYHSAKWDGASEPPQVYETQFRQFNVLLEHINLPTSTRHMGVLQKMYKLCPNELPRLQDWFNVMENHRLRTHIEVPSSIAKKKM